MCACRRHLLVPLLGVLLPLQVNAADTLTAGQARSDANILVDTLRALHPALDKYQSAADAEASFRRFQARANAARTSTAMYLAATELAASIRCGHTWTNLLNQRDDLKNRLRDAADKLPMTMTLVEGRWLVLASAAPGIAAGDELLAIDGQNAAQVVASMLPYLRADGSSDGKRLRQLGNDRLGDSMMDIVWPQLSPPVDGVYRLVVRNSAGAVRTVAAKATTLADRSASLDAQGIARHTKTWQWRIEGNHAVMTLPTFALSSSTFDWRQFFAASFATLAREHIANLVIDIRDNEGGDGAIGTALLGWLIKAPVTDTSGQSVTLYERVPYKLARYLETWDYGFFNRTGQVDKIVNGPQAGRWRLRAEASSSTNTSTSGPRIIFPQAHPFAGKAYLLVGPENSSAAFSMAQLVKQSGAATLVGQPTGGNQRGLNGGQLAWVTLPHSGVAVDIPLLATGYSASTPDAGITPDVLVRRQFALQASGRDQELEAAIETMR